jgi:protoporphyrinogen oxidase
MKENYDLIIIGGGPSGLALAQCCSSLNKNILIIEREDSVGGCHRVKRVDVINKNGLVEKMFTEHSPRVYSSTYKVFIDLLEKMDLDFYELFTPYNFSIATIGGQTIWSTLSFNEMFSLFVDFMILLVNDDYGKNMSMQEYITSRGFTTKSSDMIDRICRLTDGATLDNYTLNKFLQLFNQQAPYTLYQPKSPNDTGLFSLWKDYLEKHNVDFLLETTVEKLQINTITNNISSVHCKYQGKDIEIFGDKFIIATPPMNLVQILENSHDDQIQNAFGDFKKLKNWSRDTDYIDYISVMFHWDTVLNLDKIYGFPKTEWGVAFVVLSDYMEFNESQSKTVISTSITIPHVTSSRINKTANECTDKLELVEEVLYQLKQSFPNLPTPTVSILSPELSWSNGKWESRDTAFVASSNQPNLDFNATFTDADDKKLLRNLFTLGTHNGRSIYKFTSMESAVTNAVVLSHILYPELKRRFKIGYTFTTKSMILVFILLLFIIYVSFY